MQKRAILCLFTLFLALFCIFVISSCSKKGTPPVQPDESPAILREGTTNIPPDSSESIRSYDTSGIVIMEGTSNYAQKIDVGDVIIGQDDKKAPYGFLRKVTSKSTQGDSVIFVTQQATIFEAFEELNISETHKLRPSDVKSYKLYKGALFKYSSDSDTFVVPLHCIFYDQDGNLETTDDQIRMDGRFAFTADLFVEIKSEWLSLKKFETGIQTSQDVDLDLITNLQWEFDEAVEFDLAEFHLGAIPVGGFVWLVPTLTVEAHIHGDLTITFETGITYTQQLRFGFGYANDEFYDIKESSKEFTYSPPQLTAEFDFEPRVSLNASYLLYGVAGPYMAGKAGFHFQSVLSADPYDMKLTFDLEAILHAIVEIECDILKLDYNNEFQLYTHPIGEWIYTIGDVTPPASIINLATNNPTSNSITLTWTAPGDDGDTGTASQYDIRYSTSTVSSSNWNSATQCNAEPTPKVAGSSESFTVTGLNSNTTYYFAIKTADEVPNWSGLSNVPSGKTSPLADVTPPATITNLATSSPTSSSIRLTWTAPGDDGDTGTASQYDIRYSTSTISSSNWNSATQCNAEPTPKSAGSSESFTVTGLNFNTTYYFAIKTADEVPNWSGLSNVPSGKTQSGDSGTVTDIDGNVYKTIKIGNQWWMAENLKVTHYRNGDPIPNVTNDSTWSGLTTGAYCNYDNDQGNVATYGRLYNWYTVSDSRNMAPAGWHVPTDDEWKQLEMYLGMSQAEADESGWRGTDEGGKMKETGTTHWETPNTGATNESGFTALPGGYRITGGYFYSMGYHAGFWSSTGGYTNDSWVRGLDYDGSDVSRSTYDERNGFSVRCVRD